MIMPDNKRKVFVRWIGVILMALSFLLYCGVYILPFVPLTIQIKLAAAPVFILLGEIAFWVGGVILGKEVVEKYKHQLNPINWFRRRPAKIDEEPGDSV